MTEPDHPTAERQQHDERVKLLFSHERPVLELLAYLGALPNDREVRLVSWKTEWIAVQHGTGRMPAQGKRKVAEQG